MVELPPPPAPDPTGPMQSKWNYSSAAPPRPPLPLCWDTSSHLSALPPPPRVTTPYFTHILPLAFPFDHGIHMWPVFLPFLSLYHFCLKSHSHVGTLPSNLGCQKVLGPNSESGRLLIIWTTGRNEDHTSRI